MSLETLLPLHSGNLGSRWPPPAVDGALLATSSPPYLLIPVFCVVCRVRAPSVAGRRPEPPAGAQGDAARSALICIPQRAVCTRDIGVELVSCSRATTLRHQPKLFANAARCPPRGGGGPQGVTLGQIARQERTARQARREGAGRCVPCRSAPSSAHPQPCLRADRVPWRRSRPGRRQRRRPCPL
jgi:hypothetical protein